MTDPTTCSNCGAAVPGGAAFCTSCGTRVAEAPSAATPPPPPADATTVDGPPLSDPTLVAGAPAAAPPPPMPPAAPWAPPAAPHAPPPPHAPGAPGAPAGFGPPSAAPAGWPPSPGTAAPPPGAPTFGAPSAAPPTAPGQWGAPADAGAAWGAPAAAAAAAPKGPARSPLGGIAALLGAILTIAGVFSGWVTLGPDGNTVTDSAWSLTGGDGFLKSNDPYLLVGLAAVAIIIGVLLFAGVARPLARIAAILVGIGIIATAALNWASISSFVTDNFASDFKATTAIGFYLVIAGGVLTAVAGLLPAKKS